MRKVQYRTIWIALALVAGYVLHSAIAEGVAGPWGDQVWEIATLRIVTGGDTRQFYWQPPTAWAVGTAPAVYEKVKGEKVFDNDEAERRMLNWIGELGWEPFSYERSDTVVHFAFRRPRPLVGTRRTYEDSQP